jgi:uncharacterized glyoxalase superfamily protein PhnB
MSQTVVPMIHVADVSATVNWYISIIGFKVVRQNEEDGNIDWARLLDGNSELMLNAGGKASPEPRREVDLYITTNDVEELYRRLKDRVQEVEALHDAFYGMREFIIRDINGFWITFGQSIQT